MAELILNGGEEEFTWRLTGLSSAFNQANGFVRAGVTVYRFTSSTTSFDHSGDLDTVNAPASGGGTYTPWRTVSRYESTLTLYGWTLVRDGTYWPAGSATVTIYGPAAQRPADWDWYSNVSAGQPINISATEWNDFCDRINEFRLYKNVPSYGAFIPAYRGDEISASIVRHAVFAINAMDPPISAPDAPIAGVTQISAAFFNGLRRALNSIQ